MKKLFGFLGQRWFLTLVGTTALAFLIWFAGPMLGVGGSSPLAGAKARWIAIICLFGAWIVYQVGSVIRTRLRNKRMVEQLAAAPEPVPDAAEAATSEEIEALRSRFDDALAVLKQSYTKRHLGGRYLYELPWYLIIGPPGCGKTTALINSGLQFPLAERFGQDAIRGVGGTRNCDWWFTDKAVLLDTAGRYTTQDSYEAVDSAAWEGFLDLLKKHRPRRPINGVLVAVSISDLLEQTETERALQARAIKQRIQELYKRFGIRFPVYMLFMKSDLIAGFLEFFNDLGEEDRAQVWGMTFPVDDGEGEAAVGNFGHEIDLLEQRIQERLLTRLHQERDPGKRALIFAFPQQFAALKTVTNQFLHDTFQPNRFEERALLRGVYFTSGTQTGAPIDRILSTLAASFRLDRQALSAFAGHARSFFIERLLGDVVFPEAGLAGTNPRLERRRKWLQRGVYAGAITIALLAAAAWLTSYTKNQTYVDDVRERVVAIETRIDALPKGDRDLALVLPLLEEVRTIPGGYADRDQGAPMLMGLGLYQGDKLGSQAVTAYQRILRKALLPRIILRLEDLIREKLGDPGQLHEVLRVYLMLDTPEHYDAESIQALVSLDWEHNLPRSVSTEQREQLGAHLGALFEERPTPLPLELDGQLILQAREILSRRPVAARIYSRLLEQGLGEGVRDFTINEAAGDYADFVFQRKSGKALNQGIPALYTYDGYHTRFEEMTRGLISGTAEESWILGPESQIAADSAEAADLLDAVRDLYLRDYAVQWQDLLDDMEIRPFRDLGHGVDMLLILSDKDQSPLRRLLEAAAHETTLDAKTAPPGGDAEQAAAPASASLTNRFERLFQDAPPPPDLAPTVSPESYVTRRFSGLHAYVTGRDDKPPPIDKLLGDLNRLYYYMKKVDTASNAGSIALDSIKEGVEIKEIKGIVGELPQPIGGWVGTVAQDSGNLISGGARAHLNTIWTAEILPFCREAVHGRYPVDKRGRSETTIHDFGRLFGPNGMLDSFFKENLSRFVDTSTAKWTWLGDGIGVSNAALAQFQRAAVIREAFFLGGGATPSTAFELKPLTMNQTTKQFILDLEGQTLNYQHGPPQTTRLQWPGPDGPGRVRVVFVDSFGNRPSINEDGPWAWFKILDRSRLAATGQPELFRVTFAIGESNATFELRATSVRNPFQFDQLRQFACPARL